MYSGESFRPLKVFCEIIVLSSRFQTIVICLLVCAAGFSECGDPHFDLLMEAERQAGIAVQRCGGAHAEAPRQVLDVTCVEENAHSGEPYEAWTAIVGEQGAALYLGEIAFRRGEEQHVWELRDGRALGAEFTVQRCLVTEDGAQDCDPLQCLEGC